MDLLTRLKRLKLTSRTQTIFKIIMNLVMGIDYNSFVSSRYGTEFTVWEKATLYMWINFQWKCYNCILRIELTICLDSFFLSKTSPHTKCHLLHWHFRVKNTRAFIHVEKSKSYKLEVLVSGFAPGLSAPWFCVYFWYILSRSFIILSNITKS